MRGRRWRKAARLWLAICYGLLILLFLVGYASAYLPPRWFWWTGLLATIIPYTSLLLLLVAPVIFVRGDRALRVFHLAVLVAVVVRFFPGHSLFATREPAEDDLVLMTFNAPVRGPNPDTLARATLRLVEAVDPDLLALQEPVVWMSPSHPAGVRATPHLQAVVDSLRYEVTVPKGAGPPFDIEQPVVSRIGIEDQSQIILPPAAGTERVNYVARMRFRWKGREAVLYNVHLHTVGERKPWHDDNIRLFNPAYWRPYLRWYREAYLRRAWEAEQVRKALERETLPVILTGDFNSTVHHWEYRHLARGLRNAFTVRGREWGATYHARLPLVRIDHILVSPEWEVIEAHVPEAHAFSDHRPVVARLRWRGE